MLQMVAGFAHMLIVIAGRHILVCGYNQYGQLGSGDFQNHPTFKPIPRFPELADDETIIQAVAGYHTLIRTSANRFFGCGNNAFGQLGLIGFHNRPLFCLIENLPQLMPGETFSQVAAGCYHSVILTSMGRLFSSGKNQDGQLGVGDFQDRPIFSSVVLPKLNAGEIITQVIAGIEYTFIISSAGRLFACGNNIAGQLGLGNNISHTTFTLVQLADSLRDQSIAQVAAGQYHSIALTTDGQLLACGSNQDGKLGTGDSQEFYNVFTRIHLPIKLSRNEAITQITVSISHTAIFTSYQQLFVCGNNYYGQLSLGDNARHSKLTLVKLPLELQRQHIIKIIAGYPYTVMLTSMWQLISCGHNEYRILSPVNFEASNPYTFTMTGQIAHPALVKPALDVALPPCASSPHKSSALLHKLHHTSAKVAPQKNPREQLFQVLSKIPPTELKQLAHTSRQRALSSFVPAAQTANLFDALPLEMLCHIFSFVAAADLPKLLNVCKYFRDAINFMYQKSSFTLNPELSLPITLGLSEILAHSFEIYHRLPETDKAEFKAAFLRCFPERIHQNPELLRILPAPTAES